MRAQFVFCSWMRPTLFASVPNHIVPRLLVEVHVADRAAHLDVREELLRLRIEADEPLGLARSPRTRCGPGRPWSARTGCASGPPGTGHSFTSPVAGLMRPSMPRASSPNQMVPSLSTSSRRDRDVSAPSLNRVTASVCGIDLRHHADAEQRHPYRALRVDHDAVRVRRRVVRGDEVYLLGRHVAGGRRGSTPAR